MITGAIKIKNGLFRGDELPSKLKYYFNLKRSRICDPELSNKNCYLFSQIITIRIQKLHGFLSKIQLAREQTSFVISIFLCFYFIYFFLMILLMKSINLVNMRIIMENLFQFIQQEDDLVLFVPFLPIKKKVYVEILQNFKFLNFRRPDLEIKANFYHQLIQIELKYRSWVYQVHGNQKKLDQDENLPEIHL
ncbi:unnamed protein product [Paramecium pentaurelia]|uniref:Transmembrane protein n=1 Tax=Paramecium pentaurelia TaxID=43138 RepID=A0A8S1XXW6_9CILI|nr:unnamed protein product [Paramecium pentaurelia]